MDSNTAVLDGMGGTSLIFDGTTGGTVQIILDQLWCVYIGWDGWWFCKIEWDEYR